MMKVIGRAAVAVVAILAMFVAPAGASAAGATVTVDGFTVEAIESAMSQAGPGDTVFFPGGVYELSRSFTLASQVNYVGDPVTAAVLRFGEEQGHQLTLTATGLTNVTIRGLRFDNVGLEYAYAVGLTLKDCQFVNGRPAPAADGTPQNPTADQWLTAYVHLLHGNGVTIDGCTFLRDAAHPGRGVNLYRTTLAVVKDSFFGTTRDLEPGVPNGYFRTAINVGGWGQDVDYGSKGIVIDGNVWRRHEGIAKCGTTADDLCEDHGVYAWGVRDLIVRRNRGDGWTNTSDGGALKIRNSSDVFVLDNHFLTSGIKTYTQLCPSAEPLCQAGRIAKMHHLRVENNRIDIPDAGTGREGVFYVRTLNPSPPSPGDPLCLAPGVEEGMQIAGNTFPRGGVISVYCAEGAKFCVTGNGGGGGTQFGALSSPVVTSGCVYADAWDQPLAGVHRGDFNGDGVEDFAQRVRTATGFTWRVHLSTGDGFGDQDWGDGVNLVTDTEKYGVHVGDFDGDGRDDIAYRSVCGSPSVACWRVHRSMGTGFMAPRNFGNGIDPATVDFTLGLHTGDFNGDGRDDIVGYGKCGADQHPCWTVLAGQADATFAAQDWGGGYNPSPQLTTKYGLHVGDFDGDGRDDLVYPGLCGAPSTACMRVHRSTGVAFTPENWGGPETIHLDDVGIDLTDHFRMGVSDQDGDGRDDLGYRGRCGPTGSQLWRFHLGGTAHSFTVTCTATRS